MSKIEREEIVESKLIDKCQSLALIGKIVHKEERHREVNHEIWDFNLGSVKISYENGRTITGGMDLKVTHMGNLVFHVVDERAYEHLKTNPKYIEIEDLGGHSSELVLKYLKGSWIDKIEMTLKEIPKEKLRYL